MRQMENDNINRFIGVCLDGPQVMSLWRLCTRGSISDVIMKGSMVIDSFFAFSLLRDITNVSTNFGIDAQSGSQMRDSTNSTTAFLRHLNWKLFTLYEQYQRFLHRHECRVKQRCDNKSSPPLCVLICRKGTCLGPVRHIPLGQLNSEKIPSFGPTEPWRKSAWSVRTKLSARSAASLRFPQIVMISCEYLCPISPVLANSISCSILI